MKRIVITGATGLIGRRLQKEFKGKYHLVLLSRSTQLRNSASAVEYVHWDGKSLMPELLENAEAVINLAGENIGKKYWTAKQKRAILNSRKDAALAVQNSIEKCINKPRLWIQASATGIYGQKDNIIFNESSPDANNSFLADVCREWEKPINELLSTNVRKVIIRTGVVLAPNSDIWKQLTMPFIFRVASIAGNGKQHLPWIHIDDEVKAIAFLLENENCAGIYNLTSPEPSDMNSVVNHIRNHKKSFITVKIPEWFLKLIFGKEKTKELILTNQRVKPEHLLKENFSFTYSNIGKAVHNLIKNEE